MDQENVYGAKHKKNENNNLHMFDENIWIFLQTLAEFFERSLKNNHSIWEVGESWSGLACALPET